MLATSRLVLFCVMFSKFEAIRFICFPSHGSRLHYVSPDRRFFLQIILLKELWKISFILLLYLRFLFILINAFKTKIFHLLALNSYHKVFVMSKAVKRWKLTKEIKSLKVVLLNICSETKSEYSFLNPRGRDWF